MKNITLVAGSDYTRDALTNQLEDYIGELTNIKSVAIDNGLDEIISDDLVVLSSDVVLKELKEMKMIDMNCDIVISKRIVNYDYIDQVVLIPKGTKVLFVNDVKETAYESMEELINLGIDFLDFIPYYPGYEDKIPKVDIAITPGEEDKVPRSIKKIYNLGPRIMDFTTIIQIIHKLDLIEYNSYQFSQKYLQKIINLEKKVAQYANEMAHLNKHLEMVIDSLNDGLLVYDTNGIISIANENFRKISMKNHSNIKGKHIKSVIYNKKLVEFLMKNEDFNETFFDCENMNLVVNKFHLFEGDFIVASFRNLKETIETNEKLKRELIKKGFYAKYTFDDIIGSSEELSRIKDISRKLARTDLTILIEGETGTGKELFASSIHNESNRSSGPFLAINFSAIPDDLIESELFGYEEGAFTGAKKGGKAGLFEQADGGTIFLDEIGDASLKVQTRLLRVLEEKEVMRIGGSQIKTADVRVIAATNKNLEKLVKEQKFREDLYYRLKLGYIRLVPLRERRQDIYEFIDYFVKTDTVENVRITDETMEKLVSHKWYGNVRELKNVLSYMMAVKDGNTITLDDLPDETCFYRDYNLHYFDNKIIDESLITEEDVFILTEVYKANESGRTTGRDKLAKLTVGTKFEMTKYQMRTKLDKLEKEGFIEKSRGRRGTVLTNEGRSIILKVMAKK